jgi:hypothetical protein
MPRNLQQNTDLRYRDALVYKWDAPLDNGGSKLQLYTLELRIASTQLVTTTLSLTVQAIDYKFTGLTPAVDYECRIKV